MESITVRVPGDRVIYIVNLNVMGVERMRHLRGDRWRTESEELFTQREMIDFLMRALKEGWEVTTRSKVEDEPVVDEQLIDKMSKFTFRRAGDEEPK